MNKRKIHNFWKRLKKSLQYYLNYFKNFIKKILTRFKLVFIKFLNHKISILHHELIQK